jgi:hypothetical protein
MQFPKQKSARNPALLELARGKRCLLLFSHLCRMDGETTVAAHKNEGKGMGLKQSDNMSVWACGPCHTEFDQGPAPKAEKRRAFDEAHKRQINEWRKITQDMTESPRARAAALWGITMTDNAPTS